MVIMKLPLGYYLPLHYDTLCVNNRGAIGTIWAVRALTIAAEGEDERVCYLDNRISWTLETIFSLNFQTFHNSEASRWLLKGSQAKATFASQSERKGRLKKKGS